MRHSLTHHRGRRAPGQTAKQLRSTLYMPPPAPLLIFSSGIDSNSTRQTGARALRALDNFPSRHFSFQQKLHSHVETRRKRAGQLPVTADSPRGATVHLLLADCISKCRCAAGPDMRCDMKPLAVDLFCGLGGWTEGLLAEGYRVVGFDIERHVYGDKRYPAQLVLQNALTIHGSQFKDARLIVASPPCQEYSYMAMPWSLAKKRQAEYLDGTRDVKDLTRLFDACFRIQREACEAAGRHIPMVVENVRGAQKWVGKAAWNFGSFYLWGDVPALMPTPRRKETQKKPANGTGNQLCVVRLDQIDRDESTKVPGFRFDGSGRSFQSASVESEGVKQGGDWFNASQPFISRTSGSKSSARKAASAQIAKIPQPLARWIARIYNPKSGAA